MPSCLQPIYATVECPTCLTTFENIPVDYDEEGNGYAILESRPCAEETCGKLLCENCNIAVCAGCDGRFCRRHLIRLADGTPQGMLCCPVCARECEILVCPGCNSEEYVIEPYDFGRDHQTGAEDAGEIFRCPACGTRGGTDELRVILPGIEESPARKEPGSELARPAALPTSA